MNSLGPNQKKILLLLLGGAALAVNSSPGRSHWIIRSVIKDWKKINRQSLERSLKSLERDEYVSFKKKGKLLFPKLTAKGRHQAFFSRLQGMNIATPEYWDKKWRVVLFDIPEEERRIRNFFRKHLKRLHFFELQKSVFVQAYDCRKEIKRLSDFYSNGDYIRFIEADYIDNQEKIKKHFQLS